MLRSKSRDNSKRAEEKASFFKWSCYGYDTWLAYIYISLYDKQKLVLLFDCMYVVRG